MSNYRDILKKREKQHKKVEDLKKARDLTDNSFELNDEIKKEKFKYNFYNYLLKKGGK